jgi:hypothetical protein
VVTVAFWEIYNQWNARDADLVADDSNYDNSDELKWMTTEIGFLMIFVDCDLGLE